VVDIGDLRYDRTVTDEFASYFAVGGFADSLVDYARGKYPIDFQYRKDPKTNRQWATLYVGLTAVLNVTDKGAKGLALSAHPTYRIRQLGWSDDWLVSTPAPIWAQRWDAVERYLERVIPKVVTNGRYVRTEGIVQSAVSGHLGGASRVVLDREVGPYFRDTPGKLWVQQLYSEPLAAAIAKREPAPGAPRTPFGMECDALAIDTAGHLVAIEIKPGSVGSLAWVAAQATMYSKVLQHWVDRERSSRSPTCSARPLIWSLRHLSCLSFNSESCPPLRSSGWLPQSTSGRCTTYTLLFSRKASAILH
jgi:hypothetical protein